MIEQDVIAVMQASPDDIPEYCRSPRERKRYRMMNDISMNDKADEEYWQKAKLKLHKTMVDYLESLEKLPIWCDFTEESIIKAITNNHPDEISWRIDGMPPQHIHKEAERLGYISSVEVHGKGLMYLVFSTPEHVKRKREK